MWPPCHGGTIAAGPCGPCGRDRRWCHFDCFSTVAFCRQFRLTSTQSPMPLLPSLGLLANTLTGADWSPTTVTVAGVHCLSGRNLVGHSFCCWWRPPSPSPLPAVPSPAVSRPFFAADCQDLVRAPLLHRAAFRSPRTAVGVAITDNKFTVANSTESNPHRRPSRPPLPVSSPAIPSVPWRGPTRLLVQPSCLDLTQTAFLLIDATQITLVRSTFDFVSTFFWTARGTFLDASWLWLWISLAYFVTCLYIFG